MKVTRIYTRNIISATRSSTLQEAAKLMRDNHVGALLITEDAPNDDRAVGILTDRDLVVHAIAEQLDPERVTVDEIMTPEIAGIDRDADVHHAMHTMRELGVRRLAVTSEDGAVVGVLSLDDIVDALAVEMSSLAGVIRSERVHETGETEAEPAFRARVAAVMIADAMAAYRGDHEVEESAAEPAL
jgi:CBS domain-containing protein